MLLMVRFLVFAFLLPLALTAVALISALSAERGEVRGLPRGVWVAVIILIPLLGPAVYFGLGRPVRSALPAPRPEPVQRRVLAPDDDPEFLARLSRGSGPAPGRRTPNRDHPAGADRVDRTGGSGSERDRKVGFGPTGSAGAAGTTGERGGPDDGRTTEDVPPTGV
jgi:hypothetical protein